MPVNPLLHCGYALVAPEILEPVRRKLSVAHRVLNIPSVVALVGELIYRTDSDDGALASMKKSQS
jgi:hypothetical protein